MLVGFVWKTIDNEMIDIIAVNHNSVRKFAVNKLKTDGHGCNL